MRDSFSPWYSDIPNRIDDTVMNVTLKKRKIIYKKCYFTPSPSPYHKGIWGWAETSFGLCSSSAENPSKITFNENLHTLPPNVWHIFPGWKMKDICRTHLLKKNTFLTIVPLYRARRSWSLGGENQGFSVLKHKPKVLVAKHILVYFFFYIKV